MSFRIARVALVVWSVCACATVVEPSIWGQICVGCDDLTWACLFRVCLVMLALAGRRRADEGLLIYDSRSVILRLAGVLVWRLWPGLG